MHDSGMNQQDFNATHILLYNIESGNPAVVLFDLQRVDTSLLNSFRWPIKALAELNFSLPSSIFTENDKVFLFTNYKAKKNFLLLIAFNINGFVKKRT